MKIYDLKRSAVLFVVSAVSLAMLSACGGDKVTSQPAGNPASTAAASQAETSDAASTPAPESTPAPTSEAQPASAPEEPTTGDHALEEILSTVQQAAGIEATIEVGELDLRAGGVNIDNIDRFYGVESQTASQDGGIVIVMRTKPGAMDAVAEDMIAFRDSRLDDRYAEFAVAMEHTQEARTAYNHDVVIYAVSATGDYQALDDAISTIFDEMSQPAAS